MSISLNLPQHLENSLSAEATQLGLSLNDYVTQILSSHRKVNNVPTTGAELVAYWQSEGIIGSRPDIADGQTHARYIRESAQGKIFAHA